MDDDEADETMKDEAYDSLHTFPVTASELHPTPLEESYWNRNTDEAVWSSGSGSSSTQISRIGPSIHRLVSPRVQIFSLCEGPWTQLDASGLMGLLRLSLTEIAAGIDRRNPPLNFQFPNLLRRRNRSFCVHADWPGIRQGEKRAEMHLGCYSPIMTTETKPYVFRLIVFRLHWCPVSTSDQQQFIIPYEA